MNKGSFRITDENELNDVSLEFCLRDAAGPEEVEAVAREMAESCDGVITAEADLENSVVCIVADSDYVKQVTRKLLSCAASVNPEISVIPANEQAGAVLRSGNASEGAQKPKRSFLDAVGSAVKERPKRSTSSHRAPEKAETAAIFGGEGSSAKILTTFAALILLAIHFLASEGGVLDYIVCILAVLLTGYTAVLSAVNAVMRKRFFSEALLISTAAILSCILNRFFLAAALLYMFRMYEFVMDWAKAKTAGMTAGFGKLVPAEARIIDRISGQMRTVSVSEVQPGDTVVVLPDERIPVNGTVIQGSGVVGTYELSGVKSPVNVRPGSFVAGGMLNTDATLKLTATASVDTSAPAVMNGMLRDASAYTAERESFAAKLGHYMTPAILIFAAVIAIFPTILGGSFGTWLGHALTFIVAASPCALLISASSGFRTAVSACAKNGMMLRGGRAVQLLSECRAAVFSRTGTVTSGNLSVSQVFSNGGLRDSQILAFAALAEAGVDSPIARAICEKAGNPQSSPSAEREIFPNMGVKTTIQGHTICVGSARMMKELGFNVSEMGNFTCFVTLDGSVIGAILLSDEIRSEASACVNDLKDIGVSDIFMLTGCGLSETTETCRAVGINKAEHSVDPKQKADIIEKIKDTCGITVYVSDGIGEAATLEAADVGIATSFADTDAATGCDGIVTSNRLTSFSKAVDVCTKATTGAQINIIVALCAKVLGVIFGFFWGSWVVLLMDILAIVFAVMNSSRLLKASGRK
ncbi:MAG: cation-translocating P-type ATPase [Clostridia bacterium]|nr:cation-translocating P-type ATPase [Clostridia bacterium]